MVVGHVDGEGTNGVGGGRASRYRGREVAARSRSDHAANSRGDEIGLKNRLNSTGEELAAVSDDNLKVI